MALPRSWSALRRRSSEIRLSIALPRAWSILFIRSRLFRSASRFTPLDIA